MGHSQLGWMPQSKPWREVVGLIANGADPARVADATNTAAEKAFSTIQNDAGFKDAVHLMTQIALAASQKNPGAFLSAAGIELPKDASAVDVAYAVSEALTNRSKVLRHSSDFGTMSQGALISALTNYLAEHMPSLFAPTTKDVAVALGGLRKPAQFADLSRQFFGHLTKAYIGYFVTKTLASHVGEGQRFATTNQMSQFESALDTHCIEAAKIVEQFSNEWFSKNRHEGDNNISKETSDHFAWYALQKMRAELKVRGARDNK